MKNEYKYALYITVGFGVLILSEVIYKYATSASVEKSEENTETLETKVK
jgi:hypothetical protein